LLSDAIGDSKGSGISDEAWDACGIHKVFGMISARCLAFTNDMVLAMSVV